MDERCVIVFQKGTDFIPLRHIITLANTDEVYNEDKFRAWYYGIYRELEGDTFLYCANREERDKAVEKIQKGEVNDF